MTRIEVMTFVAVLLIVAAAYFYVGWLVGSGKAGIFDITGIRTGRRRELGFAARRDETAAGPAEPAP